MLVHHFLEQSALRSPDKVALIFQNERFTYRQIDERANQLAHALINAGLKKGDRVSLFLDNSPETVIALFGVLKAGGVFSTLSATLKTKKLEYILDNSEASFLISHWQKNEIVAQAVTSISSLKAVIMCGEQKNPLPARAAAPCFIGWDTFIHPQPVSPPEMPCIDVDLANIIYTSGSTGNPKGVMMTHLNMVSAATSITQYLGNKETDIILNVLPLSFDYGLYQIIMAFKFGGTVVLEKSFAYPYVVIDKMIKERVTGFPGVPTIFALLLQLKDLKKYSFQHLRYITNTGAALPVNHIKALRDIFPHVKIYSMYGLTECKRVSYLPPEEIDRRPTSVGRGMPNEEVYIVNDKGERAGPGLVGELVVRGSNVMRGYWKSPEETDQVLKPGLYPGEKVLYTGDLFKMDEEGYLYFVGRKDDLIKTRGERVSPKEVENTLHEIKGVAEAAVIAIPDEILGNAIKAFIIPTNGSTLTEKDILKYCSENLESFAVPKHIAFIDSFPKTSSGKIDKKALK
jgi:amino acid adenylation domain-containing protein